MIVVIIMSISNILYLYDPFDMCCVPLNVGVKREQHLRVLFVKSYCKDIFLISFSSISINYVHKQEGMSYYIALGLILIIISGYGIKRWQ